LQRDVSSLVAMLPFLFFALCIIIMQCHALCHWHWQRHCTSALVMHAIVLSCQCVVLGTGCYVLYCSNFFAPSAKTKEALCAAHTQLWHCHGCWSWYPGVGMRWKLDTTTFNLCSIDTQHDASVVMLDCAMALALEATKKGNSIITARCSGRVSCRACVGDCHAVAGLVVVLVLVAPRASNW